MWQWSWGHQRKRELGEYEILSFICYLMEISMKRCMKSVPSMRVRSVRSEAGVYLPESKDSHPVLYPKALTVPHSETNNMPSNVSRALRNPLLLRRMPLAENRHEDEKDATGGDDPAGQFPYNTQSASYHHQNAQTSNTYSSIDRPSA
jgi:hypothetical protein